MSDIHSERILVLDFGSQYTQLIARRVREAKVYCEIFPFNAGIEKVKPNDARGPTSDLHSSHGPGFAEYHRTPRESLWVTRMADADP